MLNNATDALTDRYERLSDPDDLDDLDAALRELLRRGLPSIVRNG